MKKYIVLLTVLFMTVSAFGLTYDASYYRKNISGQYAGNTSNPIYLFMDEVEDELDGIVAGTGTTLDDAYNAGNTVDVDGSAVTLTVSDTDNNVALSVVQNDSTNDPDAMSITSTADAATAVGLQFACTAGYDLQGTSDTWNISNAGAATLVGITSTGEIAQSADVLLNSTYDVAWDENRNQFIFQDNAVLGIGGAHDAAADVTFKWDASNLLIESAAEDTGEIRYGSTNAIDVAHYGNTNTNIAKFNANTSTLEFNGYDVQVQDSDILAFGDSDDVTFTWNATNLIVESAAEDTGEIEVGATNAIDLVLHANTAASEVAFNANTATAEFDGYDLQLQDADLLMFGDDDDFTIFSDTATILEFDPAAAGNEIRFGTANTDAVVLTWYSDTSGDTVVFDEENVMVEFEDVSIALGDSTKILFGDTIGTGDFSISDESDVLTFDQIVEGTGTFAFGTDGANDVDVAFYGDTASSYMKWDGDGNTNGALLLDAADIAIGDGDYILLGDTLGTGDFSISDQSDVLVFNQVVEGTGTFAFGVDGANDVDVAFYGDTASSDMIWDADGNTNGALVFDATDIMLGDGDYLILGDSSDITMAYDGAGNDLDILGTGLEVAFGVSDDGIDVIMHGETAGEYFMWDESEDSVIGNSGNVSFTTNDAEADQFKIDATGVVAGNAINFETTDGGVLVNADGADNGDIELNSADNMTFTSAGDLTFAVTGTISLGGNILTNQLVTVNVDIDDDTLTAAESGNYNSNNADADTTVFTLPTAATGLIYTFTDVEAGAGADLCIKAAAGDKINNGTAAEYYNCYDDTYGSSVTLVAVDETEWVAVSKVGTWTNDSNTTDGD